MASPPSLILTPRFRTSPNSRLKPTEINLMMVHSISNATHWQRSTNGVDFLDPLDLSSLKKNGYLLFRKACGSPTLSALVRDCFLNDFCYGRNLRVKLVPAALNERSRHNKYSWESTYDDEHKSNLNDSDANLNETNSIAKSAASLPDDFNFKFLPAKIEHGSAVNLQDLYDKLKAVQMHLLASEKWNASLLKLYDRKHLASATNLIHFLSLQTLEIQNLNEELYSVGLSNLDGINSCILSNVNAIIGILEHLKSSLITTNVDTDALISAADSNQIANMRAMRKMVSKHAKALFGAIENDRQNYVMVTVGKEAIHNVSLIEDLLKAGANIIRINCAHDDPNVWGEIIRIAKCSSQILEKPCRILMDLAGPKLRTGAMEPGPNVMRVSPKKDRKGSVISPAQVWLSYDGLEPPPYILPDACIYLDNYEHFEKVEAGDTIRFSDFKGRPRMLKITQKLPMQSGIGFLAECSKTAYVELGTNFCIKHKKRKLSLGQAVNIPPVKQYTHLKSGDLLVISRDSAPNEAGNSNNGAARITCSSRLLFDSVKPGEPISFDDGKICGIIQGVSMSEIVVSITHAGLKGSKLGSDKSINIPKSKVKFKGLTSKDLMDLEFVAANADMVGLSFIRQNSDVALVQQELEKRGIEKLGMVLKIETQSGFEKLPLLLLQAMQSPNPLGVMIARGDLAVECGWDKLAGIQEDILSICSAAHIPVVWATQVLESLVKCGLPTRAEVTDVACAMRANCIMLNKGKHIVEAVSTLDSILRDKCVRKN